MFDIFPDDIREALSDIFKILKKRNPTKIVTQFQGVINFGASSQAHFILNYFLKNSPFPPSLAGKLERLISPFPVVISWYNKNTDYKPIPRPCLDLS